MAYAVFVHLIVLEAGPDYQRSVSSHIALGVVIVGGMVNPGG